MTSLLVAVSSEGKFSRFLRILHNFPLFRVRQPRVTAPVSLVPSVPPSSSPPKGEVVDHPEGEAPQTPVRDKSLSRGFREGSLSRSIREGSVGRSIREGSPKITLPPTPITNPEKFGIKVAEKERRKVGSLSSLVSPTDSTESQDATDNMDGIISAPVSPAKSGRESNLSNSSNGKVSSRASNIKIRYLILFSPGERERIPFNGCRDFQNLLHFTLAQRIT